MVDHAPLTIVASYDRVRLWMMKTIVLTRDLSTLALRQESGTYLGFIATVDR